MAYDKSDITFLFLLETSEERQIFSFSIFFHSDLSVSISISISFSPQKCLSKSSILLPPPPPPHNLLPDSDFDFDFDFDFRIDFLFDLIFSIQ